MNSAFRQPTARTRDAQVYRSVTTLSGGGFFSSLIKAAAKKAAAAAGKAALGAAGNAAKEAVTEKARAIIKGKGRVKVAQAALPPRSGLPSQADLAVAEGNATRAERVRAMVEPVGMTFTKPPKARMRKHAKELAGVAAVNEAMQEAAMGGNGLYRTGGRGLYR